MKISIVDNKLQIICESEKDLELARDWKNSNIRQYKHNNNMGYVIALDLESVKLIRQAPVKPAYRVYSDPDGDLFVAERNPEGGVCQTFTEGCDWISPDWIEYTKWPTPLVERIAAIDIKAAEWIVDHWDDLIDDKYTYKNNYSRDCDTLTHMFDWETPPQGTDYWGSISDKLGE